MKNSVAIDMKNFIYYEIEELIGIILCHLQEPEKRKEYKNYLIEMGWKNKLERNKARGVKISGYYSVNFNTYYSVGEYHLYLIQYLLEDEKIKNIIPYDYLYKNAKLVLRADLLETIYSLQEILKMGIVETLELVLKKVKNGHK